MKKVLIAFLILIAHVSYSQDCDTQAAHKPSTFGRSPDSFKDGGGFTPKKPASLDITKMKSNLGNAEGWIKNRLIGFTGAKLDNQNNYFFDPLDFVADKSDNHSHGKDFYQATGMKGYYYNILRFFAYYCYDNKLPIHTEVESGSSVKVIFNNVLATPLCTDVGVFTVNGKIALKKFEKSRSEGRIDFYDLRAKSTDDDIYPSHTEIMIIRNSDKPVFIPITRKEYLEQMLKDIEVYKAKTKAFLTSFYEARIKEFENEISVYKAHDKSFTAEKEAKRRKWFNEDVNPEKLAKDIKKVDDEVTGAKQIITEYLGKPQEWLSRGLSSFYNGSFETYYPPGVKEYLDKLDVFTESKEDHTRVEVVSINPAYYNKALSRDIVQLISVVVAKGKYPHMQKVAALINQPGALAPLEAIINGKSTSPEPMPTQVVSRYALRYLPKLTKLTPLVVPADLKPSTIPVANYTSNTPAPKFSFTLPPLSPKLNQLPQPLTTESYNTYTQQLHTNISISIKPEEKKKADDYLKNKNQTQSKDISNSALAAWLQNSPKASLYLYSKAVITNPLDALAANNFSAFLMMGGLPEKSIPILEYWNKQKPREATLLSNLGNAYYRLGNIDKAINYLQQCVSYDTLNPTANKILCLIYLKKGDTKKAEEHGTKSLTASYDEQVTAILHQLNNKVKPGEIMSRLPEKEFPLLKRTTLPAMPSTLEEMDKFVIDIVAEKESIDITIANIESKMPNVSDDALQKKMMAGLGKGVSPLQVKAQFIIMDGMQIYQKENPVEYDVFKYHVAKLTAPYNSKVKVISKKYGDQLSKLEGGEAGDEDEIAALELARCREINAEKEKYLAQLSPVVNEYAQRQEFISRRLYRDYANWLPIWMPGTVSFPSIERDFLNKISNILGECLSASVQKNNCYPFEPLAKKEGKLKEWEDEYCANFKIKQGIGPVKIFATCNSWGIEGGEGIVGDFEMKYQEDGSFENFTLGAGLGINWHLGKDEIMKVEMSGSVKEFIKVGPDESTGKWIVKDVGVKAEVAGEASIGTVAVEEKVVEVSLAVNAGLEVGGIVAPILNLN